MSTRKPTEAITDADLFALVLSYFDHFYPRWRGTNDTPTLFVNMSDVSGPLTLPFPRDWDYQSYLAAQGRDCA